MGTSEIGSEWVKAAPADEARAVRHATHREVRVPEVLLRGFLDKSAQAHTVGHRVSRTRVDRSWPCE